MTASDCDWKVPKYPLSIKSKQIHVWRVDLRSQEGLLQKDIERFSPLLSTDEIDRARAFQTEHLRQRFIITHSALRSILGSYLDLPAAQLQFEYNPYGKPKLANRTGGGQISFNLSHSYEIALIAVAYRQMIGIDLEYLRDIPDAETIARQFFSSEEVSAFQQLPEGEKQAAFYRCWTRKEALIKAIGKGLSFPLDRFSVTFTPGDQTRLLNFGKSSGQPTRWSIYEIKPGPQYMAALVVKGSGFLLSQWQWAEDFSRP